MKPAIQIENVQKVYASGTHALKGLNLEIKQGEFFALLGPNGSGKTTLINIMSGPTKITSGTIKIDGMDIHEHREETKMAIGVVPQEISFDSFFTVNEVLQLQSGYYGIRDNQEYIDEVLTKLNLFSKKHANTRALSGGMKRRLLIAKALIHKPKIVVLDEPTAGVDVELRHTLWEYIQQLNKEGLTILLTTHYLEEAETLCDRTAIIHQGQLVALDKTKNLIKSMGNKKTLNLQLKDKLKTVPKILQEFETENQDKNLKITFDAEKTGQIISALSCLKDQIIDMDLESQSLEEVFIKLTYHQNEQ